jgi:hypothetical protein
LGGRVDYREGGATKLSKKGESPTIGLFVFSALPRGGEKVMIDIGGGRLRPYLVEQVEHFPVGSPEGSEQSAVSIYVTDDTM